MRLSNFEIRDGYAIVVDGRVLDLHNDFDFEEFRYDVVANRATLAWTATGTRVSGGRRFSLNFDSVDFLKVEGPGSDHEPDDARVLAFLGFLHPDQADVMDGFLEKNDGDGTYHMIIALESNLAIKIHAEEVRCEF